jgi:nitroimidazol reductase NimA-like FMN-containing flavoprotein (pyridoxamine 5'-phosphate oxidase superfamily)
MIEVKEMMADEVEAVLGRVGYGHLGCAMHNKPYVLPIHFAYDSKMIYFFTTVGQKAQMIDSNPNVCLQVEEIVDNENWVSIVIFGEADRLVNSWEVDKAYDLVKGVNPNLTPALSYRWIDSWVREIRDDEVIYRIKQRKTTGRRAGTV